MSAWDRWRCDCCGRFINPGAPGVSHSQTWGYCMDGSPDLHDPQFRCSPCTDKFGIRDTNCAHPERYQGRNPIEGWEGAARADQNTNGRNGA